MHLLLLLDMAATGGGDRVAVRAGEYSLSAQDLLGRAWAATSVTEDASALAYVGTNDAALPIAVFTAAAAGVPFAPLNYRLGGDQLHEQLSRLDAPVVVAADDLADSLAAHGHRVVRVDEFLEASMRDAEIGPVPFEVDDPAVLLFTSGTTATPKIVVLRHRHLTSYVVGTVEFGAADPDEAVLVSVPPYHVAGMANLISNVYGGRRIVYLERFDAEAWVTTVRDEGVTHAMIVPTMMARIAEVLEADGGGLPSLRALSYGGSRTPAPVLARFMELVGDVDLTNAYGLTETSSTIAVLGPDDHRAARDGDAVALERLGSAGKVLPTVEVEIREGDTVVPTGEFGEVWVRGEQVSGEYEGAGTALDDEGWFPTRDRGRLDEEGYLFIEGRADDTIIRGGENIAPAEIEEALLAHPDIEDCAVLGVPDDEWGQQIAAFVVRRTGATLDEDAVREFARESLRGSKTPRDVHFRDELPYTDTGKLVRRHLVEDVGS